MKKLVSIFALFLLNFLVFGETTPDWNNTKVTVNFSEDGTTISSIVIKYRYHDDGSAYQRDYHNAVLVPAGTSVNTNFHVHQIKDWGSFNGSGIYSDNAAQDNGYVQLPTYISGTLTINDSNIFRRLDINTTYNVYLLCSYATSSTSGGTFYTGITAGNIKIKDNPNYRYSLTFDYNGLGGSNFVLPVKVNQSATGTGKTSNTDYNKWSAQTKAAVSDWNNKVVAPKANGYTFMGWYKDSAFKNKANLSDSITANTTYYAKWVHHHGEKEFTLWKGTTLPTAAGNYCLMNDITLTSNVSLADGVSICIHGHKINSSNYTVSAKNINIDSSCQYVSGGEINCKLNLSGDPVLSGGTFTKDITAISGTSFTVNKVLNISKLTLAQNQKINILSDFDFDSKIYLNPNFTGVITSGFNSQKLGQTINFHPDCNKSYIFAKTKSGELQVIEHKK